MSEENRRKKFKTLDIVYIGLFAALICVCSWIAIPLTVSITLQTFAVCLTAGLLGWKRGTLTVIIYILLGMVGLPIFTGFKSGIAAVTGPTGGYIVGFIFTSLIVGFAAEKIGRRLWQNIIFMVIGELVLYLFGTIWFVIAYKVTFLSAFSTCVLPFLLPDAVKIVIASVLVNRLKRFVK